MRKKKLFKKRNKMLYYSLLIILKSGKKKKKEEAFKMKKNFYKTFSFPGKIIPFSIYKHALFVLDFAY